MYHENTMSYRVVSGEQYRDGGKRPVEDALTVEAPLQISVNGDRWTTTMRTPGDDAELVRGLLVTENVLVRSDAPYALTYSRDPETGIVAGADAEIAPGLIAKPVEGRRSSLATSSCGMCGARDARDLEVYGPPVRVRATDEFDVTRVHDMMTAMRTVQPTFGASGGSHAAAAFTVDGDMLAVREDIGRHNAVDKVVGALVDAGALDAANVLTVSGRVSYEILFKGYHAGVPYLAAVSAPSSMAVEQAERLGICIMGFCRDNRLTVYSRFDRIADKQAVVSAERETS